MARDVIVKFEVDEIQSAAIKFREYADEMLALKDELKQTIDNLRTNDWRGKAADKLFELIGEDWGKEVEAYCALMEVLTKSMDDAATTYTQFEDEARKLRLET